jgi:DNA primase
MILCPFPDHPDSDPSFKVYHETNSFHCFGCKKTGSVIDFIRHLQKLDFEGAVELLASDFRIEFKKFDHSKWQDEKSELIIFQNTSIFLMQISQLSIERFYKNRA